MMKSLSENLAQAKMEEQFAQKRALTRELDDLRAMLEEQ